MRGRSVLDLHRRSLLKSFAAVAAVSALPLAATESDRIKIGMIGSGKVGTALGRVWAKAGHEVMFSSRHLDEDRQLAAKIGANARAGTTREAAAFAEVLVLAVPYGALPEVARTLSGSISGKIVIDTCNPFPDRDGEIANRARVKGAGLMTAELLPGARVIRAFNLIVAATMGAAHENPRRFGMPLAGDDKQAIKVASRLIGDIGYEPVLLGGLDMGKHLMPGSPLSGEHAPDEVRRIAATLRP
jgi:8-hydroxy-5-deazaflavin:NADPH oxidoreductase